MVCYAVALPFDLLHYITPLPGAVAVCSGPTPQKTKQKKLRAPTCGTLPKMFFLRSADQVSASSPMGVLQGSRDRARVAG